MTDPKRLAREFFESLSRSDRFEIGDALVLGTFDWRDWLTDKPPAGFMRALGDAWFLWESSL